MRTLIANGTIVTAEGSYRGDVLVDGEFTGRRGHGRFVRRAPAGHARLA